MIKVANRAQRRKQKNDTKTSIPHMKVFNTKRINQMADDKMVQTSMILIGVAIAIVVVAVVISIV